MLVLMKIATVVQVALYCQPDAKIANGLFWTEFWFNLLLRIVG